MHLRSTARYMVMTSVLLASGCAIPLGRGAGAPTLERKQIAQKFAPDTLVATDGTLCTPSAGKYRASALHADVWCMWVRPRMEGAPAGVRRP